MAELTTTYQLLAQKYLGNSYGDLYVRIYAKYSEQNITDNKTKVQYQARAYFSGNWIKDNQGSGSVEGTSASTITGACTYPKNGETVIATTEAWVGHNSDGKKSITATAKLNFPNWGWSATAEGTADLPTIPRQATITSAPNFSDTDNPTIYYNNPAKNAVDTLQACIAIGWDVLIPYRDINKLGSSYPFEFTDAEREKLRNAATGNTLDVNFFVTTVIGGTYYYSFLSRTLTINDANPIITATVEDTNEETIALTGNNKTLIKYYSNAQATMSAEAQKGAAIDESLYIIRNGDNSAYSTTCIFEEVESNQFTFSAEDSRGNIGTANIELPMVDYIKLTCNIANNRPDALGNVNVVCSGNYFNSNFGAAYNELTVQYRYAPTGGTFSNWTDMSVTITGNSYTAYADFDIPNFVQAQSYTFETRAIDLLSTATSTESAVKSLPVFHWGENDFVFEVPVTFNAGAEGVTMPDKVEGDLNVTGNLRLKGSGNYGNTLFFGDGSYCYITEPEDDVMTIKANRINLNANGVYVDGYAIPICVKGTWSPYLNSSAISYYTTQYGWYMKMGQTVTVGFCIKATCNSGYDGTNISISGLPFTPMFTAAGGGMCSGAYVSAGFNFQCFVAETSGSITTRVQACNNTTQTNLSTSSSGCKYRSGGGELTLSGTITFMTSS
jgi:hypothetical protein